MRITIEQHTTKDGSMYWTTEHADTRYCPQKYRLIHDTFADVLEYLEVWAGISSVK